MDKPAMPAQSAPTPVRDVAKRLGFTPVSEQRQDDVLFRETRSVIPPTSAPCEHCGKDENCHTNANRFCAEYGRVLAPLKRFKPIPSTSAPGSEGGLVSDDPYIKGWNEAIEAAAVRADKWDAGGECYDYPCGVVIRALTKGESK